MSHALIPRSPQRIMEIDRQFREDIQPIIKMRVRLRAYASPRYAISNEGEMLGMIDDGMTEEAKRVDEQLAELIKSIRLDYQRILGPQEYRLAVAAPTGEEMSRDTLTIDSMQFTPISVVELYRSDPYSYPPVDHACRQCGQTSEHFFTSQRDKTNLCEACFGEREAKQLAKDVKKTRHPLDAWMDEPGGPL